MIYQTFLVLGYPIPFLMNMKSFKPERKNEI